MCRMPVVPWSRPKKLFILTIDTPVLIITAAREHVQALYYSM